MLPFHAPLVLSFIAASYWDALATDILTNRGDLGRSELNATERILNLGNVNRRLSVSLHHDQMGGQVYTQPDEFRQIMYSIGLANFARPLFDSSQVG
jgi:hypothetical protein